MRNAIIIQINETLEMEYDDERGQRIDIMPGTQLAILNDGGVKIPAILHIDYTSSDCHGNDFEPDEQVILEYLDAVVAKAGKNGLLMNVGEASLNMETVELLQQGRWIQVTQDVKIKSFLG